MDRNEQLILDTMIRETSQLMAYVSNIHEYLGIEDDYIMDDIRRLVVQICRGYGYFQIEPILGLTVVKTKNGQYVLRSAL